MVQASFKILRFHQNIDRWPVYDSPFDHIFNIVQTDKLWTKNCPIFEKAGYVGTNVLGFLFLRTILSKFELVIKLLEEVENTVAKSQGSWC